MGQSKQLLSFRNKPILQHVINNAHQSMLDEVIVVLGHNSEAIEKQIDWRTARVVENLDYQQGQSSSVKSGISEINAEKSAALFLLADQPLVTFELINRIIDHYKQSRSDIIVPRFKGKRGNPVLFKRSYFDELSTLPGDSGGRLLFQKYSDQISFLDMPDGSIIVDIDTPEDYLELKALETRDQL